jgi:hypothetical protein
MDRIFATNEINVPKRIFSAYNQIFTFSGQGVSKSDNADAGNGVIALIEKMSIFTAIIAKNGLFYTVGDWFFHDIFGFEIGFVIGLKSPGFIVCHHLIILFHSLFRV